MASMAAATQLFALSTVEHANDDHAAAIATMDQFARGRPTND